MDQLLRSRVNALPKGPFALKHLAENTFELHVDGTKIAILSFADLASQITDQFDIPQKDWKAVLEKWVEEGGAHIRWVSWAHRPIAFPDDQYLTDATELHPNGDLKDQYARCPGDRAYIGELHRNCVTQREQAEIEKDNTIQKAKIALEALEGRKRLEAIALLKAQYKIERVTEAQVQAFLDSDQEVIKGRETLADVIMEAKQLVINAQDWEMKYKNVLKALDDKVSMLMMLGAQLRSEMQLTPHED